MKNKEDWIPPTHDLYTPGLVIYNKTIPKDVRVHYPHNAYPMLSSWFDRDFSQTNKYRKIISITKLQVRHLPYLGTAFTGELEICYVPWIIAYIKKVLHENDTRD